MFRFNFLNQKTRVFIFISFFSYICSFGMDMHSPFISRTDRKNQEMLELQQEVIVMAAQGRTGIKEGLAQCIKPFGKILGHKFLNVLKGATIVFSHILDSVFMGQSGELVEDVKFAASFSILEQFRSICKALEPIINFYKINKPWGYLPITKTTSPKLYELVQEVSSNLHCYVPDVLVYNGTIISWLISFLKKDKKIFNAFFNPFEEYICLGNGLIKIMTKDEIKAILAHEMGHMKKLDERVNFLSKIIISWILIEVFLFIKIAINHNNFENFWLNIISKFLSYSIGATIFEFIGISLYSKSEELYADDQAIQHYGLSIISALKKLEALEGSKKTLSIKFIGPLFKCIGSLFKMHPSLQTREEVANARLKILELQQRANTVSPSGASTSSGGASMSGTI